MKNTKEEQVDFNVDDIVVVESHWYPCLDNRLRPGQGGKYVVKFKFRSGNFFGEPMDNPGYTHVAAAKYVQRKVV